MGVILKQFGPWYFEVRIKSVILHTEDDSIEFDRDDMDDDLNSLRNAIDDLERYTEEIPNA